MCQLKLLLIQQIIDCIFQAVGHWKIFYSIKQLIATLKIQKDCSRILAGSRIFELSWEIEQKSTWHGFLSNLSRIYIYIIYCSLEPFWQVLNLHLLHYLSAWLVKGPEVNLRWKCCHWMKVNIPMSGPWDQKLSKVVPTYAKSFPKLRDSRLELWFVLDGRFYF